MIAEIDHFIQIEMNKSYWDYNLATLVDGELCGRQIPEMKATAGNGPKAPKVA